MHSSRNKLYVSTRNIQYWFKAILTYALVISSIYFLFKYYLNKFNLDEFLSLPVQFHVLSYLFYTIILFVSGLQMRYIYRKLGFALFAFKDSFQLPISMNLMGYILPFQGSMIYQFFYLKTKYKSTPKTTTSFYITSYLFLLVVFGLVGASYGFIYKSGNYFYVLVPIIIGILPFTLLLIPNLHNKPRSKIPNKIHILLSDLLKPVKDIYSSRTTLFNIILYETIILLLIVIWSYMINHYMSLNLPVISFLFLSLSNKLSLILKFTPGNLGTSQGAIIFIFTLLSLNVSNGLLISLYQSFISICVAFTLGAYFVIHFTRRYSFYKM